MIMVIAVTTYFTWLVISGMTLVPTPSSSPTVPAISAAATPAANGIDSTVLAAWIGFVGAILVALIAGGFALYQMKRNAQQAKELLHLQKMLEAQQAREEREQQRQETEAEAAQVAMRVCQNTR
jgi:uncharacterized protein HemX